MSADSRVAPDISPDQVRHARTPLRWSSYRLAATAEVGQHIAASSAIAPLYASRPVASPLSSSG